MSMKILVATSGNEPANFLLVGQCLNQLRHCVTQRLHGETGIHNIQILTMVSKS